MDLIRTVARPALASMFIWGGQNGVKNADYLVPAVQPLELQRRFRLPFDDKQLVVYSHYVMIGAGGLLAIGKFPRLASAALISVLIPTTIAGHRYWEVKDDQGERLQQQIAFYKNVSMIGGLLLATVDTGGRASRARQLKTAAKLAGSTVEAAARPVVEAPKRALSKVSSGS